jgi:hypothetical protein
MSALPLPSRVVETWRCADCGELVDLDEVILEKEFGYEGEAWGYFTQAQEITQVLSPCCRAFIVNDIGNFLSPDDI